jgi:phytanoyl-CoA hydroxylase
MNALRLTQLERASFARDGYIVKRSEVSPASCRIMQTVTSEHLQQLIAPVEYEVDVQYPGSPLNADAPGARTPRRLLQAYARHDEFRQWATNSELKGLLQDLFADEESIMLSQCHHNCVMTKTPGYSSATLWHQDNRYWSFDYENLISVWLALGDENRTNGCLRVIAGSHLLNLDSGRFDASMFLRPDLAENKALISQARRVELSQGDVLFFHSRLFHAAGRNLTDETKLSVVFSYHQASNKPIKETRSDRFPSILL